MSIVAYPSSTGVYPVHIDDQYGGNSRPHLQHKVEPQYFL